MITQTGIYMGKAGEKRLKPGVGVGLREPPGLETGTHRQASTHLTELMSGE